MSYRIISRLKSDGTLVQQKYDLDDPIGWKISQFLRGEDNLEDIELEKQDERIQESES